MNPEEPNKAQPSPASQSAPPATSNTASGGQTAPPTTPVQQPATGMSAQPSGSKNSLKIILAVIGGVVLIVIVVIVTMAISGSKKPATEVTPTATHSPAASSSTSSAPALPSGFVPVENNCYRAAAPTDHKLSNDNACYIHVYYGVDKSAGYMVAEMTGDSNATAVENWKKSNTYPIVSEESIKVGGLDAKKIVYSIKVGSSIRQGVIVFVATPGKNYKDGSFDIKGFEISAAAYGNDADKTKATFDTVIDTWYWK